MRTSIPTADDIIQHTEIIDNHCLVTLNEDIYGVRQYTFTEYVAMFPIKAFYDRAKHADQSLIKFLHIYDDTPTKFTFNIWMLSIPEARALISKQTVHVVTEHPEVLLSLREDVLKRYVEAFSEEHLDMILEHYFTHQKYKYISVHLQYIVMRIILLMHRHLGLYDRITELLRYQGGFLRSEFG